MLTFKEFQKAFKWILILATFLFPQITMADNLELESKRIDLYLIRWFTKLVENLNLTAVEEGQLIDKYGKQRASWILPKTRLIPTLAVVSESKYLSKNARKYHLAILNKTVSLTKAGPGLAILQLKYLAITHSVNYMNCALYTYDFQLPVLRYCKEMTLALLDFSLMATNVLCNKLATLSASADTKNIFKNFSKALSHFNLSYRWLIRRVEDTPENSTNSARRLCEHVQGRSDYWCSSGNVTLFKPMKNLNVFINQKKQVNGILPPIKKVTQGPLQEVINLWLQVDSIYLHSLYQSDGKLNFMKALFNSEIELLKNKKTFDENTIKDLMLIEQGDYELEEDASDERIVVRPVAPVPKLISF